MRIFVTLLALVLSGCAPPRILGADENGVIVARGGGSEQETVALAQQHCQRFGLAAIPTAESGTSAGSSPAILFNCVKP